MPHGPSAYPPAPRRDVVDVPLVCAALQWATISDPATRPVLLRRETEVGRGARALSRTIELSVDADSFLASQVGLSWSNL